MESWSNSGGGVVDLRDTIDKICSYGVESLAWGSSKTTPETEEIKRLNSRIEMLNSCEITEENRKEFLAASKKLDDLLLKQEIFWKQQSRISWLKHEDRNTKFFHSKVSQRRKRNFIQGMVQVANEMKPCGIKNLSSTMC